jgi:endonuclease/exonuclease/phosphatase family metal-dependent hydrolase
LLFLLCLSPAHARDIKITTWNLNWLTQRAAGDPALPHDVTPRRPEDFARLRAFADHLDADIIALQEIDGEPAAARLFDPARYTIITIRQDVVQQVALAVRAPITVRQNTDVTALDVEPPFAAHHLRYGLDATVTVPGGATLRILAVHLKTGCHVDSLPGSRRPECILLARQIPPLTAWLRARAAESRPFVLLGDFNRVLDDSDDMQTALTQAAPLLRAEEGSSDPCWDGGAFIDHIFLGGTARAWMIPDSVRVLTYHSTDPTDRDRLSDHCPLSVRLSVP